MNITFSNTIGDPMWSSGLAALENYLFAIHPKGASGKFLVTGEAMTWRKLDGYKVIDTTNIEEFVDKVISLDTAWIVEFDFSDDDTINAVVRHHDSLGECRSVIRLETFLDQLVRKYSLQALQLILTGMREAGYDSYDSFMSTPTPWLSESHVDKPRRQFNKRDFAAVFAHWIRLNFLDPFELTDFIKQCY